MEIQDIKKLKRDIKYLRIIEGAVSDYKNDNHCDKLGFGFNLDSRFKGSGDIIVWLGGYKGYYGSSSVTSIFDIDCKKDFKEAFIATLNELRPQILNSIADKMQVKLKEQSDKILNEINNLKQLYDEANSETI